MLHLSPLTNNQTRFYVPPPLLEALLQARVDKKDRFTIAFTDQLAPVFNTKWRAEHGCALPEAVTYSSIGEAIQHILAFAPPANVNHPLITMAPNLGDNSGTTGSATSKTWLPTLAKIIIAGKFPWKISPHPVPRTDNYAQLARADAIVKTESTEGYANLLVTVNPQELVGAEQLGRTLLRGGKKLTSPRRSVNFLGSGPTTIPGAAMQAGHGNAFLIVGPGDKSFFSESFPDVIHSSSDLPETVGALSKLIFPDTFPNNTAPKESRRGERYRLGRNKPLVLVAEAKVGATKAPSPPELANLEGHWSERLGFQTMDRKTLLQEIARDPRFTYLIQAEGTRKQHRPVVMIQGITPICPNN